MHQSSCSIVTFWHCDVLDSLTIQAVSVQKFWTLDCMVMSIILVKFNNCFQKKPKLTNLYRSHYRQSSSIRSQSFALLILWHPWLGLTRLFRYKAEQTLYHTLILYSSCSRNDRLGCLQFLAGNSKKKAAYVRVLQVPVVDRMQITTYLLRALINMHSLYDLLSLGLAHGPRC